MPELDISLAMVFVVAVGAYVLGSIPFGLVIARLMGLQDPRGIGSGSIGATNVLRTGSKAAALATVLLDAAKGTVAVIVAHNHAGDAAAQVAAFAAVVGHSYPIWLKFKGGKGVATIFGGLLGLSPMLGLVGLVVWLLTFYVSRISSLSALTTAVVTPFVALIIGFGDTFLLLVVLAALLVWRHRANIGRLRAGTEPKVGDSKS